jgi:hypothetical protein
MPTIPFVPGATAGALLWRQNCNPAVGAIGCIPPAPIGNRDYIAWCSRSELQVNLTVDVDEIDAVNTCVRVPAQRTVTGAAGTITGCRVQDAALLELVNAADPVIYNDAAFPATFALGDEVGYAMDDFGANSGCQGCGAGCDFFSMLLWLCAYNLRGCVTPLPRGVYAVVAIPSFQLTQPKELSFGGARDGIEDGFDFEMDLFDLSGNSWFQPCVFPVPGVVPPARGPEFLPGPLPIFPDTAGMAGSPLSVFLTEVPPPVTCDCCGEAGFWDDGSGGGGGGGFNLHQTISDTLASDNPDATAKAGKKLADA